jgi:putative spermidine/putrescine transport system permease protein
MRRNGPLALAFHALFMAFMLAPLVVVALVAFTPDGYLSLPLHGPSLRWFRAIGDDPDFMRSFWISVKLGLSAATLATVAVLPAALAIGRRRFLGREPILAFVMSPLMVPAVVLGVGLLRLLTLVGLQGSFTGLVLCHAVVIGPYVLRMVLAAVAGLDADLDRAAVSLGASPLVAFWRVTVPLLASGIAGGWILAFVSSFDELTVTIFVSSPQVTPLPLRLFSYVAQTTDPLVASVSALIMGLTTVLLILLDRLYGVDRLFSGTQR